MTLLQQYFLACLVPILIYFQKGLEDESSISMPFCILIEDILENLEIFCIIWRSKGNSLGRRCENWYVVPLGGFWVHIIKKVIDFENFDGVLFWSLLNYSQLLDLLIYCFEFLLDFMLEDVPFCKQTPDLSFFIFVRWLFFRSKIRLF